MSLCVRYSLVASTEIPADGFGGTGAPGLYLEHLLGLTTSNVDVPDAGAWEVKYTSGNALLTLFHKDPYPARGRGYATSSTDGAGRVGMDFRASDTRYAESLIDSTLLTMLTPYGFAGRVTTTLHPIGYMTT